MLGPALGLGEDREDVVHRLRELAGKRGLLPLTLPGRADLAGDENELPAGTNAMRKAFGAGPAGRLENFHKTLNLKRCSLPVSVRGSESTNSIARGYL